MVVNLIFYCRQELIEVCLWTLNNYLIAEPGVYLEALVGESMVLKAVWTVWDKIKKRSEEMMSELLWLIFYISESVSPQVIHSLFQHCPKLI